MRPRVATGVHTANEARAANEARPAIEVPA